MREMSRDLAESIRAAAAAERILVMGIVNVTPDSFSDGGRFDSLEKALAHARRLASEGANILDIGGESTRPGAAPVDARAEIERVVPVIEAVRAELDLPVSIDTMKGEVMRAAVAAGAEMINDVNGLRDPDALVAAVEAGVPTCIMHMQGEPRTMQQNPDYDDVVEDLRLFFRERIDTCLAAGMQEQNLVLDPGFGFGKSLQHNLDLLDRFGRFREFGLPLMAGISRKSMLGKITGREAADARVAASVAAGVLAAERGANILRVHDVAETVDAVSVIHAMRENRQGRQAN
ncbi:MAG TPA: dihydropteroate synthase [Wenzhouxiangellaceae bacterium]|nr:dihydropteroate synthase [Wenzhouxiangellaceae bacterium]